MRWRAFIDGNACCAKNCGKCGGAGCSGRAGGASRCPGWKEFDANAGLCTVRNGVPPYDGGLEYVTCATGFTLAGSECLRAIGPNIAGSGGGGWDKHACEHRRTRWAAIWCRCAIRRWGRRACTMQCRTQPQTADERGGGAARRSGWVLGGGAIVAAQARRASRGATARVSKAASAVEAVVFAHAHLVACITRILVRRVAMAASSSAHWWRASRLPPTPSQALCSVVPGHGAMAALACCRMMTMRTGAHGRMVAIVVRKLRVPHACSHVEPRHRRHAGPVDAPCDLPRAFVRPPSEYLVAAAAPAAIASASASTTTAVAALADTRLADVTRGTHAINNAAHTTTTKLPPHESTASQSTTTTPRTTSQSVTLLRPRLTDPAISFAIFAATALAGLATDDVACSALLLHSTAT